MATKAVRFSENEDKAIKGFLKNNPFLDFSTLARIAIKEFIESPKITLTPTKKESKSDKVIHG